MTVETNIALSLEDAERLAPEVESTVYRLVQEALTERREARRRRAPRHRAAEGGRRGVMVSIRDDGRGFDPSVPGLRVRARRACASASRSSAARSTSSPQEGKGTLVRALIPARTRCRPSRPANDLEARPAPGQHSRDVERREDADGLVVRRIDDHEVSHVVLDHHLHGPLERARPARPTGTRTPRPRMRSARRCPLAPRASDPCRRRCPRRPCPPARRRPRRPRSGRARRPSSARPCARLASGGQVRISERIASDTNACSSARCQIAALDPVHRTHVIYLLAVQ